MDLHMEPVSLPEKDYLSILDMITRLHDCQSRREIRACIGDHLLPLLNGQSAAWGWIDIDFSTKNFTRPRLLDCVGFPKDQYEQLEKISTYFKSLSKTFIVTTRSVIATDVDMPREVLQREKEDFFADYPEYQKDSNSNLNRFCSGICIADRPDFSVALGVHRLLPNDKRFSHRDVRVMELILPHLLQVIKTVALNEELTRYKALAESLAEVPTAIALISLDHRVLFRNAAFYQLLPLQPGQHLPSEVSDLVEREAERYDPPFLAETSVRPIPFVNLPQGVFRLKVTLLNPRGEIEDRCWLVRLKPAVEPFSKMNRLMQEGSLTEREMEVATLVRDGIKDREIAGRLFISLNTVKNHVKSIHRKFEVNTRAQLVARLNQ